MPAKYDDHDYHANMPRRISHDSMEPMCVNAPSGGRPAQPGWIAGRVRRRAGGGATHNTAGAIGRVRRRSMDRSRAHDAAPRSKAPVLGAGRRIALFRSV
jgi:hypothetical protein